jgi:CheY-like chemotaxis protein
MQDRSWNLRPTVLVIDDDPDQLVLYKLLFEKEEYEVVTAESAKKGLEVLSELFVSAVVCDVNMPEIDGREFVRHARRLRGTKGLPVIAFSAGTIFPGEELERIGADCFVPKSDSPRLIRELKRAIDGTKSSTSLLQRIQEGYRAH